MNVPEPSSTDFTDSKPCAETSSLCRRWTAELWGVAVGSTGGDTRVTWARAWSLHCEVGPAWASAGNSHSCPVQGSPGTSCTYLVRGRALLAPSFLHSGTLLPTDKQPASELVRHWSGLVTGLSNTEEELLHIFPGHCQNRNTTSTPLFSFSSTSCPERNQGLPLSNALESNRGS